MDVYFRSALWIAIVAVAAANVVAAAEVGSDTAKALSANAGLRAYADPETGDLVVPESVEASDAGSGAARSLPLTIVPAPTEAGGVMVDLRGQFRHATRAHVDAGGTLSAECVPGVSPP